MRIITKTLDANDNTPSFHFGEEFLIYSTLKQNSYITKVKATDADTGRNARLRSVKCT